MCDTCWILVTSPCKEECILYYNLTFQFPDTEHTTYCQTNAVQKPGLNKSPLSEKPDLNKRIINGGIVRATRSLLTKLLSRYFLDARAPLGEVFINTSLAHVTAPCRVSIRVFGLRCLQSQRLSYAFWHSWSTPFTRQWNALVRHVSGVLVWAHSKAL